MYHGPFFLMEPMNHVLPSEGRWHTGDASARTSEETGVQVDPVQARLDELLKSLESQESLRSGLFKQHKSLSTKTRKKLPGGQQKQQNHSDKLTTMLGEMEMINGLAKAGAQAGTINWSNASWRNTKPTNNPTTVPTWNGDAKLFDDYEFDVLMCKRGSNPGDHCFLVPRLISGLTGRART